MILLQGSFQIPQFYSKLVQGLVARGYPTIHPQLPTCSNVDSTNFPQLSLLDDALATRTEVTRQIEYERKTVVVVMHSYDGLAGSKSHNRRAQLRQTPSAKSTRRRHPPILLFHIPAQRRPVGTERLWRIAQQ